MMVYLKENNLIYSISYNDTSTGGSANIKLIQQELRDNQKITTVEIDNLNPLYNSWNNNWVTLKFIYSMIPTFPLHIENLIFNGNDLSEVGIINLEGIINLVGIINLIINIIKNFKNVSTLSFQSCKLTNESATNLLEKLKKLEKKFKKIDLSNNDELTEETKEKFDAIKS